MLFFTVQTHCYYFGLCVMSSECFFVSFLIRSVFLLCLICRTGRSNQQNIPYNFIFSLWQLIQANVKEKREKFNFVHCAEMKSKIKTPFEMVRIYFQLQQPNCKSSVFQSKRWFSALKRHRNRLIVTHISIHVILFVQFSTWKTTMQN